MSAPSSRGRRLRPAVVAFDHGQPISRPTYPAFATAVICLLAVLALAATFQVKPHIVTLRLVDLHQAQEAGPPRENHTLRLTHTGMMLWDGEAINQAELVSNLQAGLLAPREPTIAFVPDANAGYELSAQVLAVVVSTGVTKLSLPNICAFRVFGKTPAPLPLTIHLPLPEGGITQSAGKLPMTPDCTWRGEPLPVRDWKGL